MPIDDPLDQALARIAAEERQSDPAVSFVKKGIDFATVMANFGKALATTAPGAALQALSTGVKILSEARADSNSEYLLSVVIPELQRVIERFDQLDERHRRYLDTDWLTLLVDADHKARLTRGREKVNRIAAILSSSPENPDRAAEDTEEMMRVAMSLSDVDVVVLGELARANEQVHAPRGESRGVRGSEMQAWDAVDFFRLGLTEHAVESKLGKLYSFGLVAPLNFTKNRPPGSTFGVPINAYELLKKGWNFIDWSHSNGGA